jgi:formate hydrogenlyase subunit 3/multisubunit Na+/H+ antiporter MnhD subunit
MADRLVVIAAGLLALSGVPGLLISRRSMTGQGIAAVLAVAGAVVGLAGALLAPAAGDMTISAAMPGPIPGLAFALRIDGLAAIFLLPIFLMAGLGSVYGMGYWRQADHPSNGRKLRLFYGLLAASQVLVVIAHDGILFLIAWEIMALSTFFLVTTEDDAASSRRAGWVYLVATHVGTLCLFLMFAILRKHTGSFALEPLAGSSIGIGASTCLFALALGGFGVKAGIMPLHVWLPAAHAISPSHVSAMLSGVVLKIGVYGLFRMCALLPQPPVSWGAALLVMGAISSVVGVAFALAQHDLKRLLAYHSIENIGIIVMGLGLAMIGRSLHRPEWIVLGLAGALLHTWNHALFKSLLFLAAGSVIHAVGTRDIDRMGGLARRMPATALLFTIGAVAICGLPPLNGFVSELLVYLGLFGTVGIGDDESLIGPALAAPVLAGTGALAVACFVKVVGAVFLGQPRLNSAGQAHESPASMLGPMALLAALCAGLGLAPFLAAPMLQNAIEAWTGSASAVLPRLTSLAPLTWMSMTNAGLIVLAAAIYMVILGLIRHRPRPSAVTWDCGFAAPTPKMQYTASSLAQSLVGLLAFLLRPREHRPHLHGHFPHHVGFRSHVDDVVLDRWVLPALRLIERWFGWLRVLQYGRVQLYVFYVLVTLIVMLLATFPVYDLLLQLLSR